MIDLHSHILPGVDDGARDFDESIKIIRALAGEGISSIVATPHYIKGTKYVSSREANEKIIKALKNKVSKENVSVRLELWNEVYIDEGILGLIETGEISLISKYLLVELPLSGKFPNYRDILLELIQNGYKVVLAHPERYASFQEDFSRILELDEMGVLMQCNLGSLVGKYGKKAKKTLKKMIKERLVFMFGTDSHREPKSGYFSKAIKKLAKYYNEGELEQVLTENSTKILERRALRH